MYGIVLAAGGGTRLRPLTDTLPKTLLPVDGDRTIFEFAVANLAQVDVRQIVVIVGHAAQAMHDLAPAIEQRHGVTLDLVHNDKYDVWNNAYSLWLARDAFAESAILINGDTLHPVAVEERLLQVRGHAPILLALDDKKSLAEEEMKVLLDDSGRMTAINKALDPSVADGEYIGVTLIEPEATERLSEALEETFQRDTTLYYEDGYQQYADWGGIIRTAPIGIADWVEVDNHDDLARARELACRF